MIGRNEDLLAINHKYYTFRGSETRQKVGERRKLFFDFMILFKISGIEI